MAKKMVVNQNWKKPKKSAAVQKDKEKSALEIAVFYLLVILAVTAFLGGCVVVTIVTEDKMFRLIAWGIGIFLMYYLVTSVAIVGAEEVALLIFSGVPVGRRGSGPCLVPKWFAHLERFPTTIFELDIVSGTVVTMKGVYEFEDKDGAKKKEMCEQDPSEFDATIYFSLPYTSLKGLIRALKAKVPKTEEGLKKWIDTSVNAAIGRVGSRMTWRQFSEDRQDVCRRASIILRDGLFGMAGFRVIIPKKEDDQKAVTLRGQATQNPGTVLLLLKRTEPSKKLQRAIQQVNIESLQEEAAESDAREIAMKSGGAFALGIQNALNMDPEKAAAKILQDSELKGVLLSLLDGSIRDHIAGNEGKLVRVSVNGGAAGSAGNSGGGGNFLADALIKAIAAMDGMNNCQYHSRLLRILGMEDGHEAGSGDGAEDDINAWARKMGVNPDTLDDEEAELEEEEEEQAQTV